MLLALWCLYVQPLNIRRSRPYSFLSHFENSRDSTGSVGGLLAALVVETCPSSDIIAHYSLSVIPHLIMGLISFPS
jgi:hypothetical protein